MNDKPASQQIDDIIKANDSWKGDLLAQLRKLIRQADPSIIEEVKWKMRTRPEGLAVWSHGGIICFVEIWKDNVKLLFPKGASLNDPNRLFNARLLSKDIRAIEFKQGDPVDTAALIALTQEAVALNLSVSKK